MIVSIVLLDEDEFLKKAAESIREGVANAGESVSESGEGELAFVGFRPKKSFFGAAVVSVKAREFAEEERFGRKIALFYVYSSEEEKTAAADYCALVSVKTRVVNSLGLRSKQSLFKPVVLSEESLVRARGFGERTTNNVKDVHVRKESEKQRIQKYFKNCG